MVAFQNDLLLMTLTGDVKIWYFSVRHKLQFLDPFLRSTKYSAETMLKLATVVYLILPT